MTGHRKQSSPEPLLLAPFCLGMAMLGDFAWFCTLARTNQQEARAPVRGLDATIEGPVVEMTAVHLLYMCIFKK